jgi:hypothetical protein
VLSEAKYAALNILTTQIMRPNMLLSVTYLPLDNIGFIPVRTITQSIEVPLY